MPPLIHQFQFYYVDLACLLRLDDHRRQPSHCIAKTHQASRLNQKKNKRLKVIITVQNEVTGKKMVWYAHVILFQEKKKPPQSPTS